MDVLELFDELPDVLFDELPEFESEVLFPLELEPELVEPELVELFELLFVELDDDPLFVLFDELLLDDEEFDELLDESSDSVGSMVIFAVGEFTYNVRLQVS